ncbi:MAG: rhodanese-like domain-containing protein [Polaribacter sp.]|uniref:rhodanese-like domain-containing protein n=1 Tax=Polaribacter sp. TaxID=1920175 RepID=UPI002F3557CD
MKKITYIFVLSFFFINCDKKQEVNTITTSELKVLLSKEKVQLLDVRTQKEIKEGFIETAFFANFYDENFYTQATVKLDKTKPVYLYCRSGNRSGKAGVILQEKGYKVVNVLGGYNQWKQEN